MVGTSQRGHLSSLQGPREKYPCNTLAPNVGIKLEALQGGKKSSLQVKSPPYRTCTRIFLHKFWHQMLVPSQKPYRDDKSPRYRSKSSLQDLRRNFLMQILAPNVGAKLEALQGGQKSSLQVKSPPYRTCEGIFLCKFWHQKLEPIWNPKSPRYRVPRF